MSFGNELLAEQLKQNHASLLAAQGELSQAKERGLNTSAIEKEIAALKQNEQALEKEANGGKLLTTEKQKFVQQALLAAQAELAEAKERGQNTAAIEQEIVQLQKLDKLQQQAPQQMQKMRAGMQGLRTATQQLKEEMKEYEQQMSQAFATAVMGALESGKSIGAALEAATKAILEQLATQSLAQALYNTAQGFAMLAVQDYSGADEAFTAAGIYAAVAGAAGAAGMAMPGGGGGGKLRSGSHARADYKLECWRQRLPANCKRPTSGCRRDRH